ncbi:MAG TPA: hypothetical protein VEO54_06980 [Thermoanaerobaculia bacterium]|nr:hypothetical protein [Thermoanaerobaculia bacterium]
MRRLLAVALFLISVAAAAQDDPKPISIALEPLGDDGHGVVVRVFFRFANPRAITEAGLFLEGSFTQRGRVPRNFRFAVPRKGDKMVWNKTIQRNSEIVNQERWAVLPDQRNELAAVHTFAEGEVEVDVRLVLEGDRGSASRVVGEGTETVTLAKTNVPFAAAQERVVLDAGTEVPERTGEVTIRAPRRNAASGLFLVEVDAGPSVKRVEFLVGEKKVLARNRPPYRAELDLGDAPLRAIGYDAAGRYVDADAFVASKDEALAVQLTHVATSDGVSHFKVSVRSPKGTPVKSVALYADDRKLHEWDRPPFALSLPSAALAGVKVVRVSVFDEAGNAASDRASIVGAGMGRHE